MKVRHCIYRFSMALTVTLLVCGVMTLATEETFSTLVLRLQQEEPTFAKRQQELLAERYDLSNHPAAGVTMSRGKPVQEGVRVKPPSGMTWEKPAAMSSGV